jgi:hypothetical protein
MSYKLILTLLSESIRGKEQVNFEWNSADEHFIFPEWVWNEDSGQIKGAYLPMKGLLRRLRSNKRRLFDRD